MNTETSPEDWKRITLEVLDDIERGFNRSLDNLVHINTGPAHSPHVKTNGYTAGQMPEWQIRQFIEQIKVIKAHK